MKKEGQAVANRVKIKIVKNKVAPPFKEAITEIVFGQGIDSYGEIVDLGIDRGIIAKRGAWMTMPDGSQCQGREGAKQFLREHPDVMESIKNEILGNKKEEAESDNPSENQEKEETV